MSKEWMSTKTKGLQTRIYPDGKVYRLKAMFQGKTFIDYFGLVSEEQAILFTAQLKNNRKNGIKPDTYKEMLELEELEKQARHIEKINEIRTTIAMENFNKNNTIVSFWDNIYWPMRSKTGNQRSNNSTLNTFNKWWRPADCPLQEIKSSHIQSVLDKVEETGVEPRTIEYVYSMLQAMYNYAILYYAEEYDIILKVFPGKILKLAKVDNEKTCWLEYEEATLLLAELKKAKNKNSHDMAVLALFSGLRFGDIAKLTWQDVETAFTYAHGTKSGKSYGVHTDVPQIAEMLKERKERTPNWQPEDLIFTDKLGQMYKEIPDIYPKTVKKLGLNETPRRKGNKYERINFHALRHTFASWLAMDGVDLHKIMLLLGHSDIKMTLRYARLDPKLTKRNVLAIAENFTKHLNV